MSVLSQRSAHVRKPVINRVNVHVNKLARAELVVEEQLEDVGVALGGSAKGLVH